ncbi:hypothetical protein K2E96_16195 [Pseudomonas sp. ERGC3:05]|nr:hypothetical protein [Pseudomonas sp. ERGC3:01]QZC92675.1 hypothetical protein K2E96_16195 [Pseudomonas sp. ERGC3:05]
MYSWLGYSDPRMEDELYEPDILPHFAEFNLDRVPDKTTTLSFLRSLFISLFDQRNFAVHQWLSG